MLPGARLGSVHLTPLVSSFNGQVLINALTEQSQLYEKAWEMDTTQSAVAAALGAYQMQRGNIEQAIRFWSQALAISPALVLVRTNLATALLRTGHAEQAQATLRQALEFQPSLQEARDLLNRITK